MTAPTLAAKLHVRLDEPDRLQWEQSYSSSDLAVLKEIGQDRLSKYEYIYNDGSSADHTEG